jgi:hypothetical protein
MAFEHSREGAGTSHTDVNIAYKAWDNSNWMARIEGESFWHFREGALVIPAPFACSHRV